MNVVSSVSDYFVCAKLSYQSSVDALTLKPILLTSVLTPIFYLLFFFLVRVQSLEDEQISFYLLRALLILPVGLCIFYVGSSFSKLKHWGVMRSLLLAETSLFSISMQISTITCAISFVVTMSWFVILQLFVQDFGLTIEQTLFYILVLSLSISAFAAFGVLCSVLILPLEDRLIVTNSLFYIVIIFSGLFFQYDTGVIFWLSHILPLTPFISVLSDLTSDTIRWEFLAIGVFNIVIYLTIAKLALTKMIAKMQQGHIKF